MVAGGHDLLQTGHSRVNCTAQFRFACNTFGQLVISLLGFVLPSTVSRCRPIQLTALPLEQKVEELSLWTGTTTGHNSPSSLETERIVCDWQHSSSRFQRPMNVQSGGVFWINGMDGVKRTKCNYSVRRPERDYAVGNVRGQSWAAARRKRQVDDDAACRQRCVCFEIHFRTRSKRRPKAKSRKRRLPAGAGVPAVPAVAGVAVHQ